jgi:hypothetical protein
MLSAPQQFLHLKGNGIFGGEGALSAGRLVWRWSRRPTALSRLYTLRLEYKEGDIPRVYVEQPDLALLAEGEKLPHVYEQRPTRLCLYLPGAWDWRPTDRLDQSVMPWADLWLYYFEDWLRRGKSDWQGGGVHPGDGSELTTSESRFARRYLRAAKRQRAMPSSPR